MFKFKKIHGILYSVNEVITKSYWNLSKVSKT